jgi:hypothetical protein
MSRPSMTTKIVGVLLVAVASGCATGSKQLATQHYTLTHPEYWKVKKTASQDGDATLVVIPQYGAAVIDEGTGAMEAKESNYDAVTADVEVRLYTWPVPDQNADPTEMVSKLLLPDPELALRRHMMLSDNPPECGVYPKKYVIFGNQHTPLDLISRPGWRTILVGAKTGDVLLGVVARVDYEPDRARNCHNLANMRVQLQNLLDGVQPAVKPVAAPGAGNTATAGGTPEQSGKP